MNLISMKTAKDCGIDGIEFIKRDGGIREVVVRQNGAEIHISGDYGLTVSKRQDFTEEKRHVVSGELAGIKIRESFDDSWAATQRKTDLEGHGAKVELAETPVKIDDQGIEIPF